MKILLTLTVTLFCSFTGLTQYSTSWIPLPTETNVTNGATNGMWFTAQSDFTIKALMVPDGIMSNTANQSIAVLKFTGSGAASTPSMNYSVLFLVQDTYALDSIPCNVDIEVGDHIGIIGSRFNTSVNAEQSSNTTTAGYSTSIGGNATPLYRLLANSPLGNQAPNVVWMPSTSASIVRIEMYLETCQAPEPTSVTSANLSCFGDTNASISASITGSGGPYIMEWSTGDSNINSISNLGAGMYTLSITDNIGCVGDSVVEILEPDSLYAEFGYVEPLCFGASDGQITANVFGGTSPFTYLWSNSTTANPLIGAAGGNYLLSLQDSNGCAYSEWAVLTQPELLELVKDTIQDVICAGDSNGQFWVITNGGTIPYTYLWNDPQSQTLPNATNLSEDIFTLTATDLNGCIATLTDSVGHVNDLPEVDLGPDIPLPASGNIVLNAPASMNAYLWSTSSSYASLTVTLPGQYWVSITDSNTCSNSDTINILEPAPLSSSTMQSQELKIFPNPAFETLNVQLPAGLEGQFLSIVDAKGSVLHTQPLKPNSQVDLSQIPGGLYILRVDGDNSSWTSKLSVVK